MTVTVKKTVNTDFDGKHDLNDDTRHPVATGTGAMAGAVAGGAIGLAGGPITGIIGAVIGGMIGGVTGDGVAETFDPSETDAYWRTEHNNRFANDTTRSYDRYRSAYIYGESQAPRYKKDYSEVESDLRSNWDKNRADSDLSWEEANTAVRDSYNRRRETY